MISDTRIRKVLLQFAADRREGATFCPSEVARALDPDWRPLMPRVREVAATLCDAGQLCCTQRAKPGHPLRSRGAIRLSRPPASSTDN